MGRLAVCTSFGEEFSAVQSRMTDREEVSDGREARTTRGLFFETPIELILMGAGAQGVERLARLDWSEYIGFLHLGYCGGLDAELAVGDLVLPERLLSGEAEPLELEGLNLLLKTQNRVHAGPIVTVEKLVRTKKEKAALNAATSAIAVDMESFPLAKRAIDNGLSLIVLKAVADGLGDDLPDFGHPISRESIKAGTEESPELARKWRENMATARTSLISAADQLIPALHQIWSF